MLKWTSESEYFLSFEKIFADTIYHIQSKSNHFTPSAAHARRGVISRIKHGSMRARHMLVCMWLDSR